MDSDFVVVHDCVGRPTGWRRILADAVCRWTGHLLWRVLRSEARVEGESLPHFATYCRRCYRGGYVRGDYYRRP